MAVNDFFNAEWYLSNNPDVREAVEAGSVDARTHFELHGRSEGRSPSPAFDPAYYLDKNPDVQTAVDQGLATAYDHFLLHGQSEARAFVPFFDVDFYMQNNADVRAAVGDDPAMAVTHFLLHGQGEARPVSPFFDLNAYLDANPDVKAAVNQTDASSLEHLLLYGVAEGRPLGNGMSLAQFANDPVFQEASDPFEALARVAEVAPFMPSFEAPEGWEAPADTPIPQDFVPVEGEHLVVPPTVEVPEGTELPDAFEPVDDAPGNGDGGGSGGGGTGPVDPGTPMFTMDLENGQLVFGGSGVSDEISIVVAADGFITATRSNVTAENTEISIEGITGASVGGDDIQVDISAVAEHVATDGLTAEDLSYLSSVLSGAEAISDDITIAEGVEASEVRGVLSNIDALADGRNEALLADLNSNGPYDSFESLWGTLEPLTEFRTAVQEVMDKINATENPGLDLEALGSVADSLHALEGRTVSDDVVPVGAAAAAHESVNALIGIQSAYPAQFDLLVNDLAASGPYGSFRTMSAELESLLKDFTPMPNDETIDGTVLFVEDASDANDSIDGLLNSGTADDRGPAVQAVQADSVLIDPTMTGDALLSDDPLIGLAGVSSTPVVVEVF